jgi:hypothetical protein
VTRREHLSSVLLDGQYVTSLTGVVVQSLDKYSVAAVRITSGIHTLSVDSRSNGTLAGYLYGHANYNGYGFPVAYQGRTRSGKGPDSGMNENVLRTDEL